LYINNNCRVGHSYPSSTNPTWKYAGQQQQSSYGYDHSLPRSSMPVANIPQAPLFDADLIANTIASLKNRQSIDDSHTSYEQSMVNNKYNNDYLYVN
jgi:hypothetical protein